MKNISAFYSVCFNMYKLSQDCANDSDCSDYMSMLVFANNASPKAIPPRYQIYANYKGTVEEAQNISKLFFRPFSTDYAEVCEAAESLVQTQFAEVCVLYEFSTEVEAKSIEALHRATLPDYDIEIIGAYIYVPVENQEAFEDFIAIFNYKALMD